MAAHRMGRYNPEISCAVAGSAVVALTTWPPEVDIQEVRGECPDMNIFTQHYDSDNKTQVYKMRGRWDV